MKAPPYFPFFQRDFVHSCRTSKMSADEIGALVMVMCQQWENMGPLASDPEHFAAYTGWDIRVAKRLLGRLSEINKIDRDEQGIQSSRMAEEITKYISRVRAAEAREARKVKDEFSRTSSELLPNFSEKSETSSEEVFKKTNKNNDTSSSEAPLPDIRYQISKEKNGYVRSAHPDEANFIDDSFEAFWQAFPAKRRRGKVDARKAFVAIATGKHPRKLRATPDEIVAAVKAGRGFDLEEPPMPTTWLNGGRWLDDMPQSASDAKQRAHWWQDPDKVSTMTIPRWRHGISQFANGVWRVSELGPPPGDPRCVVPKEIIDELKLTEKYDRNGLLRQGGHSKS